MRATNASGREIEVKKIAYQPPADPQGAQEASRENPEEAGTAQSAASDSRG
jgi:hypothetical protein